MQLSVLDAHKIEQSPDCISAYDAELNILIWNRACEEKFGIPKEEALSRNLLHLFPHIEEDYRVGCFRKTLHEGESFFFPNLPLLYTEGVYSQAILPLHNEQKAVVGTLNIIRNGEHHRIKKEDLVRPLRTKERAYSHVLHIPVR